MSDSGKKGGKKRGKAKRPRGGGDSLHGNTYREDNDEVNGNSERESGSEVDDQSTSIVNASLIVNLSNANVSVLETGEDGELLNVSSDTVVGEDQDWEQKYNVDKSGEEEEVGDEGEEQEVSEQLEEEKHGSPVKEALQSPVKVEQFSSPVKSSPEVKQETPQKPDVIPSPEHLSIVDDGMSPAETPSNEDTSIADSEVEQLMAPSVSNDTIESQLPGTVTVLTAPNGVKVYLVGTAHFSQQSHLDVIKTIQLTNPTLVLLELCSSRRNILTLDEETILKEVETMNFQKVRLALSNSGAVQGVLHLLLLSMSAQLTKKLGMAPGGEFRCAMKEARKIPGCVLLLGDRPFNITISRALAALTFFQKLKLAWQFLTSNEDITKEEIEKCKELDAISMLLKEMTGEFPSITEVFVNERDTFLAHSLYLAATSEAHGGSGRDRVVVGVVGFGHILGIARNWGKTTEEEVNELLRIPETPLSSIILRYTFKTLFYGALTYGAYRLGRRLGAAPHQTVLYNKLLNVRGYFQKMCI